jgi:hypothetical protein
VGLMVAGGGGRGPHTTTPHGWPTPPLPTPGGGGVVSPWSKCWPTIKATLALEPVSTLYRWATCNSRSLEGGANGCGWRGRGGTPHGHPARVAHPTPPHPHPPGGGGSGVVPPWSKCWPTETQPWQWSLSAHCTGNPMSHVKLLHGVFMSPA